MSQPGEEDLIRDYVSRLLEDSALAAEFEGGWCLIFRLCVDNYHRYAWFASGTKSENRAIPGAFHTVRPVALEDVPVLAFHPCDNTRTVAMAGEDFFGRFLPATGAEVMDVDFREES